MPKETRAREAVAPTTRKGADLPERLQEGHIPHGEVEAQGEEGHAGYPDGERLDSLIEEVQINREGEQGQAEGVR